MLSEELKKETIKVWLEYGEAIKKAFNLNGFIKAEPVIKILQTEDEKKIKRFIEYIKDETKEISETKWMGEK